jgi:hypothetical protein
LHWPSKKGFEDGAVADACSATTCSDSTTSLRKESAMSTSHTQLTHEEELARPTAGIIAGGSLGEGIGGAAAVVLSIIGLANTALQGPLLAISGIAVGAGLLFQGGAVSARFTRLMEKLGGKLDLAELGGGTSAEFMGGVTGVVLGILALVGVEPRILMPIAAIVFGGALAIGSGVTGRMRQFLIPEGTHPTLRMVGREAIAAAVGLQVLVGLGAVALGVIALAIGVGEQSRVLTQVAFLGLGGAIVLSSSAITAEMLSVFRH